MVEWIIGTFVVVGLTRDFVGFRKRAKFAKEEDGEADETRKMLGWVGIMGLPVC